MKAGDVATAAVPNGVPTAVAAAPAMAPGQYADRSIGQPATAGYLQQNEPACKYRNDCSMINGKNITRG